MKEGFDYMSEPESLNGGRDVKCQNEHGRWIAVSRLLYMKLLDEGKIDHLGHRTGLNGNGNNNGINH